MQLIRNICLFFALPILLHAGDVKFYYDADITSDEALKDLRKITLFLRFPASSPGDATACKQGMIQELEKLGKVQQRSLFVDTPLARAMDVSNLPNSQASMIFEIAQLIDSNGKELPVVKASLRVLCETEMGVSEEKVSSVVWNRTYYSSKEINSLTDGSVRKTFKLLVDDFVSSHKKANPATTDKMCFYLLEG